ncbi:MAG: hypothetical protein E7662_08455 [Ruminococcaceae bacterium]|nr:hypothetical protein [Oscillospiraceae bacterium]
MRRIASLFLVLAMLTSALTACAGDPAQPDETSAADTTTAADSAAETTSPPETEASAYNYLPEKNYNGYKYRILYQNSIRYYPRQIDPTEQNGDIVNDSAYERNMAVETKYNVKTVGYPMSQNEILNGARNHVKAGDDAFDVYYGVIAHMASFTNEGNAIDLAKMEYIDLSQPWYNQDINAGMNIKGKQYIVSSEFINVLLANTYAMYFNKRIAYNELKLPDLYELALDGKWTFDKFIEMTKGATRDLDGDGKMTHTDTYGYGAFKIKQGALAMQYGMGQFTTDFDENGDPRLILNSDRMAQVVGKINNLTTGGEFYLGGSGETTEISLFKEGRILFLTAIFMQTDLNMRDMADEYGILPHPKLNEDQDKYYTVINTECFMYSVPITVKDQECSTVLFEAYSYEGYKYVYPGYYELALKTKYSHDDVSARIYDLIMGNRIVDFGFVFGTGSGIRDIISTLATSGSTDFASAYASKEAAAKAAYAEVMKNYQ